MACEVIISPQAHIDETEIALYIADELHNPQAALRFLDEIQKKYDNIRAFPKLYPICHNLADTEIRRAVLGNFLILYKVSDDGKKAYVRNIVYGGSNYVRFLEEL